ncbi:MAG: hypothetical protein WCK61_01280 [Candidatus Omnitrophota bacterium]
MAENKFFGMDCAEIRADRISADLWMFIKQISSKSYKIAMKNIKQWGKEELVFGITKECGIVFCAFRDDVERYGQKYS